MQETDKIEHDRNATIKAIRSALQRRSGKQWSVTGGRGTAWGWIHIDAPPARRTWSHREKPDWQSNGNGNYRDQYEAYDTGEPGRCTSPADAEELAKLLGFEGANGLGQPPHGIPASSDYRREYIDRAEGRAPSVIGQPYWD